MLVLPSRLQRPPLRTEVLCGRAFANHRVMQRNSNVPGVPLKRCVGQPFLERSWVPILATVLSWTCLGVPGSVAQEGRVCVAALNVARASETDPDHAGNKAPREFKYQFTVQFDENEAIGVPIKTPRSVALATGHRHLVRVRDAGELIESFYFTFEERGKDLCLSYTSWYQTWLLDPPRPGASWCTCKQQR